MSNTNTVYRKSVLERFFYAFLFEVLGIGISTPLAAWLSDHEMMSMGVVTVVIAIMALLLNMGYNALFDWYLKKNHFTKTTKVRIVHAVGFETTLFMMTIPFICWYLGIGAWEAIVLDIGLILFYLPYTYLFNLCYDIVRSKIVR
ncbi:hypothetical protein V757_08670 [Pelistega indica]|uniref:Chlorhexidine efflux transporter domain-containing protein n=1 Tax=Pelistega indica TaxID=1414851 RepID=V8G201_9BURK|nr:MULTISPECIES: PACE efflux transporter [Pelistega]ETD69727.1 hypothetical protein V757_08670 [Pelistega indica]